MYYYGVFWWGRYRDKAIREKSKNRVTNTYIEKKFPIFLKKKIIIKPFIIVCTIKSMGFFYKDRAFGQP